MTVPAGSLADTIAQAIREGAGQAISDSEASLAAAAAAAKSQPAPDPFASIGDLSGVLNLILGALTALDPEVGIPVEIVNQAAKDGGGFGAGIALGYIGGYLVSAILPPVLEPLQHAVANIFQTEVFDPMTAARLVAHGEITQQFGESEAAGGNMDKSHFDTLVDDQLTRPDVSTLLDMRNRDLISDADVELALQRHGIPSFWHPMILNLRRTLLSGADLALAYLRGNIDQQTMEGYAAQIGITPADMAVLVENTGEPPGPQELMFALRRGIIDHERFVRGILQSRVRNEWVDVEYALRYGPMSTDSAVRAVVESYLTSDEGQKIAEQNGLLPEHWPVLVESWGRPLSHEQMLTLFHRGQADRAQVVQAMKESDVKNKYIEQAIELGRALVPERTIVSMLSHGVISHQAAATMLLEHGFTERDAAYLIELGTHEHTAAAKELSKTDILTLYRDALMTQQQAEQHLATLGYAAPVAHWLIQLEDAKAKAALVRSQQGQIRASLHAHHLTPQQAQDQLVALGVDRTQAKGLVDEWVMVRGAVTRTLTEAQIIKAAKHGVLDVPTTTARLQGLGLSASDVTILLTTEGVIGG